MASSDVRSGTGGPLSSSWTGPTSSTRSRSLNSRSFGSASSTSAPAVRSAASSFEAPDGASQLVTTLSDIGTGSEVRQP
jgi:hypothetical protein